jgi:sigma-B regulation protein RsbU (phosphoserine phosphatase)
MAAPRTPTPPANPLRTFWDRVTAGLELRQLVGQFQTDAKASYRLYSKDANWEKIAEDKNPISRTLRYAWALFLAALMQLSPARRVLLLVAIVLLALPPEIHIGRGRQFSNDLGGLGVAILFVLLALELADRVTMKRDLEIAREIQEWLVPKQPPGVSGVDIAFATRPQNTVAGDYYDAFLRPVPVHNTGRQPLLIAVADVAGKSVPAALLMATFQASLHTLTSTSATLDEVVAGLDRYCCAHSLEGRRFTTAFLAEMDVETHEMVYVNAGHNSPILRRSSGTLERLSTGGPPFGIPAFTDENRYPSGRVQLGSGDLLFIFTDGVVEAVNEADEAYGEARLLLCVESAPAKSANEVLTRVMGDVNTFVGPARQHDDITSLALRLI